MEPTSLLLLLSPFLALALVLGTVMVVAILRARREDVPVVLSAFVVAFCRLADRMPRRVRRDVTLESGIDGEEAR
ncbi:MAG: hypothetical protein HOV79_29910 [Hamadaea sp.]|nr:hypothetical protein [Hamadaea sp.]